MGWLWETEVETNDTNGSVKDIKHNVLKFSTLWGNYPSYDIKHSGSFEGVQKNDGYGNHCAINVSEALLISDIQIKSVSRSQKCYGSCTKNNSHVVAAQNLANWLNKIPFAGCPKAKKLTGKTFETYISGKTGIVFFKDYWQRKGEEGEKRTGDHIDLWDNNKLASIGFIRTFARLGLDISIDGIWSDFTKSTEVLFWEIK